MVLTVKISSKLIHVFKTKCFPKRERELKLEKARVTHQQIQDFKRQRAERRRVEQEKVEAENRRIMEFAEQQQNMEEARMKKIREREEAKEHLYKKVETHQSGQRHLVRSSFVRNI